MNTLPQKFLDALVLFSSKVKDNNINWAIFGSLNLALQGVDVTPHDIDIITDYSGFKKIEAILANYISVPSKYKEKLLFKSYYLILNINGIEFEIIAEIEERISGKWQKSNRLKNKTFVNYNNLTIPYMELNAELIMYKAMGRDDKVKLIKEKLKRQMNK